MAKSSFALPLSIAVLSLSSLLASGQQPPVPVGQPQVVPPRQPTRVPAVPSAPFARSLSDPFAETEQKPETLSSNYRFTFSGKSDEKSLGELSALTCSRKINLSGPLNSSETPTMFTVSGTLEEKDGLLIFSYSIGYRAPLIISRSGQPGQPNPPGYTSIQYQDHSSQGTLRIKPGKAYELLRSGGCVYSITVTPETE